MQILSASEKLMMLQRIKQGMVRIGDTEVHTIGYAVIIIGYDTLGIPGWIKD